MTEPVVFLNRNGLRLFGVLHHPEAGAGKGVGIVVLPAGVKMRIAPCRLYNDMAERWARSGYAVLRFDFAGLGDSEGEAQEELLADLYAAVQSGRYVGDTLAAMDYMHLRLGLGRFILTGLCGGAITALLTAARDSRVDGVLGIGLPVVPERGASDRPRAATRGQAEYLWGSYGNKVMDPGAWARFLTFRTGYRTVARTIWWKLRSLIRRGPGGWLSSEPTDENLHPAVLPAFHGFARGGAHILVMYGGADRHGWEFQEFVGGPHADRLQRLGDRWELHVIPGADHILSDPSWRQEMHRHADDWLRRHFAEQGSREDRTHAVPPDNRWTGVAN